MGYEQERYDSPLPECGQLRLQFDGRTLDILKGTSAIYSYPGVSGQPIRGDVFDYSRERQKKANAGPIPEGTYWIRPVELSPAGILRRLFTGGSWGNYRITIHPFTTTETYGRGGFFIHGGTHVGSAGCINLHSDMDRFVKDLQSEIAKFGDCKIQLEIRYPQMGDFELRRTNSAYA
jgi:hypothetical protein